MLSCVQMCVCTWLAVGVVTLSAQLGSGGDMGNVQFSSVRFRAQLSSATDGTDFDEKFAKRTRRLSYLASSVQFGSGQT